jgi:predicted O-methyltransferase YrrM
MKLKIIKLLRKANRRLAINNLKKHPILFEEIVKYMKLTKSTGISWSDFWILYKTIREKKPKSILECGPGASTLVITYALMENEKEGFTGRVTAMEEIEGYLKMSVGLLPTYLHRYVDFILSPRIDDYFGIFRGVRYRDIPEKDFDFVFIDGPEHHSPNDNQFCFDYDFLYVLQHSTKAVSGLIDYRLSTGYVLQTVLGFDKVKYNCIKEIGMINPCNQSDLKQLNLASLTSLFNKNANILGNTKIVVYK